MYHLFCFGPGERPSLVISIPAQYYKSIIWIFGPSFAESLDPRICD